MQNGSDNISMYKILVRKQRKHLLGKPSRTSMRNVNYLSDYASAASFE
jgi:hypothetical protein